MVFFRTRRMTSERLGSMGQFKFLLTKLATSSSTDKVYSWISISELLCTDESEELAQEVKASNLILSLAKTLQENTQWAYSNIPEWVGKLVERIFSYWRLEISTEQTQGLVEACLSYLATHKNAKVIEILARIASLANNKMLLLMNRPLYNIIKSAMEDRSEEVIEMTIRFLMCATDSCPEWQSHVLDDSSLVLSILSLATIDEYSWGLLANLSTHPDAKVKLPCKRLLEKAAESSLEECTDICAMLCTEDTATSLKLPKEYIEGKAKSLEELLEIQTKVDEFYRFSLLDIILPLVNLSVVDANKEVLGQRMASLLLQVLLIENDDDENGNKKRPLISNISECLVRGKQEAAKTLWNLAFTKQNQERIKVANGINILKILQSKTNDKVLQTNIAGILYMIGKHKEPPAELPKSKKHVMISYSWAQQPVILRLAHSIKNNGYDVWLDVEQMSGSTLDAMARAIENSSLVLMCMSQKYKDSPNCRLEGEYCINSKVPFIPLMVQEGYKPDGWLGLALGSKLYYPFWDEVGWESKISALLKGMSAHHTPSHSSASSPPSAHLSSSSSYTSLSSSLSSSSYSVSPPSVSPTATITSGGYSHTTTTTTTTTSGGGGGGGGDAVKELRDWRAPEVLAWMKAEGISQHSEVFTQQKLMDGRALAEMKGLLLSSSTSQPLSSLLSFFREWMGICEVGEMMLVISALRKL